MSKSTLKMRKGSALLIVLGMTAFMIVSAVSFAVFMRQSRAPSGHLRRQVSSRYLLRSALANAIAQIDGGYKLSLEGTSVPIGIFDNPYPGLGDISPTGSGHTNNLWTGRVFTPNGLIDVDQERRQTISTLSLEALAYLPPALINDVRVNSRKTQTAIWQNLAYEAGRYAYTAVNVSDCFDINKVRLSYRRTSAPNERISMAPIFMKESGDIPYSDLEEVDKAIEEGLTGDGPQDYYASLADFNRAMRDKNYSEFFNYLKRGNNADFFQGAENNNMAKSLFITDTWFPQSKTKKNPVTKKTVTKTIDLTENQPFDRFEMNGGLKINEFLSKNILSDELSPYIGGVGMAVLYDYLDKDSRPCSLCIPTVEAVPMVCGIGLNTQSLAPEFKIAQDAKYKGKVKVITPQKEDGTPAIVLMREAKKCTVSLNGRIDLFGVVAQPFKKLKEKGYDKDGFTADILVKIWCGDPDLQSRFSADSTFANVSKNSWEAAGDSPTVDNGVISLRCKNVQIASGADDKSELSSLRQVTENIDLGSLEMPVFWHVEEWHAKENSLDVRMPNTENAYYSLDGVRDEANALKPYDKSVIANWWTSADAEASFPEVSGGSWNGDPKHQVNGLPNENYVFHIGVWMRVMNKEGETVDMVPASFSSEKEFGLGEPDGMTEIRQVMGESGDLVAPVLEFRSTKEFKYSIDSESADSIAAVLKSGEKIELQWDNVFCSDPKYNWAPENWYCKKMNDFMTPQIWFDEIKGLLGNGGRDSDIYMFSSDREYLQSMGELAFIPMVKSWDTSFEFAGYRDSFNGASMKNRNSWKDCACEKWFWKSYSPFADEEYPYFLGDTEVISGKNDFRINPLTDDLRVMMSAIAETPADYFIASTNDITFKNRITVESIENDPSKYAFTYLGSSDGAENSEEREVVVEVARFFNEEFRKRILENPKLTCEEVYHEIWMDYEKEEKKLFGIDLGENDLHSVDRKFLYSYWRECFQNRQQLFLIFVRAEPLTVGGSSGDAVGSSQLGARGVALVWRDPEKPETSSKASGGNQPFTPHRTRVLFFHQFD